ncbi:MAG: tetraacyldisaccharide 4'-kinase, partial [Planctomycetota bacterium]
MNGPLSPLLWVASWFYRFGIWLRNQKFDSVPDQSLRVDVPVISVGNLTTGGTGKTPVVSYLAQKLR